jgi:hypothetical protein
MYWQRLNKYHGAIHTKIWSFTFVQGQPFGNAHSTTWACSCNSEDEWPWHPMDTPSLEAIATWGGYHEMQHIHMPFHLVQCCSCLQAQGNTALFSLVAKSCTLKNDILAYTVLAVVRWAQNIDMTSPWKKNDTTLVVSLHQFCQDIIPGIIYTVSSVIRDTLFPLFSLG